METIEALQNAVYEANREAKEAHEKANKSAEDLANAIAESLGVTIGCTVIEHKEIGYGRNRREQERRYKVESFRYKSYGQQPLAIIGRTIRKDGTTGERHEIYGSWEVEKGKSNE